MSAALVVAHKVSKTVRDGERDVALLSDVSVQIQAGERVALVGPSGSGKSSLLNILGALDPDYQGDVTIAGESLRGLSDSSLSRFRNRTMGFVFQSYNLLGHLSVLENVLLPARFGSETPNKERAQQVLERVGLVDKLARMPSTLSGGERQRVAIARALYHTPKLLLCDEPTGNLDRTTGKEVLKLFEELSQDGVTLLIATHDEEVARSSHRSLTLVQGILQ